MKAEDVAIRSLNHQVTLRVKIKTEFKVRKFIALTLIRLAVWVLGCGLEVEE